MAGPKSTVLSAVSLTISSGRFCFGGTVCLPTNGQTVKKTTRQLVTAKIDTRLIESPLLFLRALLTHFIEDLLPRFIRESLFDS